MSIQPETARSEISSAISDDCYQSKPQSNLNQPSIPNPSTSQHGYLHLRGVTQPNNRSIRSPPPAPSTVGSSRPQSPVSQTSRTHVPSLTAQGFAKPMSSQRLQAQRLKRPLGRERIQSPPPESEPGHFEDDQSIASSRQGPFHAMPKGHRPIPSLATEMTQSEAPENYDTVSHGQTSHDGDTGLVNGTKKEGKHKPTHLNIRNSKTSENGQKSPMSFRSGFSLGSKRPDQGHQILSSNTSSPGFAPPGKSLPVPVQSALGKNHEYFEGNTMFWWGGRLQNARDRPINIATGIVLVLPAILFFVYS